MVIFERFTGVIGAKNNLANLQLREVNMKKVGSFLDKEADQFFGAMGLN